MADDAEAQATELAGAARRWRDTYQAAEDALVATARRCAESPPGPGWPGPGRPAAQADRPAAKADRPAAKADRRTAEHGTPSRRPPPQGARRAERRTR
jgi:hypothetical protein